MNLYLNSDLPCFQFYIIYHAALILNANIKFNIEITVKTFSQNSILNFQTFKNIRAKK